MKPEEVAELLALILSDKGGNMTAAIINYDQLVVEAPDQPMEAVKDFAIRLRCD